MNELLPDILICITNLKHYCKHKQSCTTCITYDQKDCDCGANSAHTEANNLINKIKDSVKEIK